LKSIQEGAFANLKLAVQGLQKSKIENYVIIGGWCPFLNRGEKYHPGTIDVDILFKEAVEPYYLKKYIEVMREFGYFTSAKHQFQLLNVFEINSFKFCYNIDLLHTATGSQYDYMFVDQLDLNVVLSNEERQTLKMKSIVQKESKVIFDANLYEKKLVDEEIEANFVTYLGMFITKLISCQKEKRDRDSYDIYLGFENDHIDLDLLSKIYPKNAVLREQFKSFVNFLSTQETRSLFDRRVTNYRKDITKEPSGFILEKLEKIT
jgi:hypothetical protein